MEEDLNAIAADCLVISCCCQCLILQFLIIILLRLPYKFFRGALAFAKKKLRNPRKKKIKNVKKTRRKKKRLCHESHDQEIISPNTGPTSSNNEELQLPTSGSCNMNEVEKVLGEFFDRGEFGFGRFWDVGEEKFPTCLDHRHHQELDYDVVSYHLIRMFGSCSSNGIDHQSLFQL